jgi:hypothetical protein
MMSSSKRIGAPHRCSDAQNVPGENWKTSGGNKENCAGSNNTLKAGMDVSKVPAECQESDENDGHSSLKGKEIVQNDIGGNPLKFS